MKQSKKRSAFHAPGEICSHVITKMWCETNKWFLIPGGTGSLFPPPSGKRLGWGPTRRLSFHICLFCLLALLETVIVVCICMLGHFDPWWWFFSSWNPRTFSKKWDISVCLQQRHIFDYKETWESFFFFYLFFLSVKHLKLCGLVCLIPTWSSASLLHLLIFFPFTLFGNLQQVAKIFFFRVVSGFVLFFDLWEFGAGLWTVFLSLALSTFKYPVGPEAQQPINICGV